MKFKIAIISSDLLMLLGAAFFKFNEELPVGIKGEKAEALAPKNDSCR